MTELLWMPAGDGREGTTSNPNYLRSFDARVLKTMEDWLLLDRTAFYAEGGGQPSDVGVLTWDGGESRVKHVSKRGAVKHQVDGPLPAAGTVVHGEIDWQLRFDHMRMHTSQHLLSGVVWKLRNGRTAGNQIHADQSRVDFEPVKFDASDLVDIENEVNRILDANVPILVYEQDRSVLEQRLAETGGGDRSLLNLVPQSVKRLRIVEIADPEKVIPNYGGVVDMCPCAGTHVARTGEIGRMEILGRETKGAQRERITYLLK